ncbi:MAG: RNA polymerase factor sigma-54 [Rhodobacteraceae bacterium]|nr:RNA polymerase factor sigma-54 [Paracoccaceae bacterium]
MTSRFRIGVSQSQRLQLSSGLHAALRVLRSDAAGLARYLDEQAAEAPALTLHPVLPAPGDWLPRWSGVLPRGCDDLAATLAATGPSLMAHVMQTLPLLVPQTRHQRIALSLAEALEPTGWLGRPLSDIARELTLPLAEVETVLASLQRIDPPGLFARDLAECLRLQAADAGSLDPVMQAMLARLDLVASGDWAALARLTGASESQIHARFRTIRSFNPKPGTAFSPMSSPLREPDLIVRQAGTGWEVTLNRSSLPGMALNPDAEGAARAREVMKLVESRNTTLLVVAQAVLTHQAAALNQGPGALRPLTMQALAQDLGLHKSTISRVVAGTAVDTPHGTWWLRSLFSADMGADTSAAALQARLARLIAEEDPSQPQGDVALALALSSNGTDVARRTVAKYRAALNIPPAHRRRKT